MNVLSKKCIHRCLPRRVTTAWSREALFRPQGTQPQASIEHGSDTEDIDRAKPFHDIPGPPSLPFIHNLYLMPRLLFISDLNRMLMKKHKQYGAIYKESYGPSVTDSLVHLFDAADVERLIRHDGTEPRRMMVENWQSWRDECGHSRGILIDNGPAWRRMRLLLNKQMLRPKHVASYCQELGEVTVDFVDRIRRLRDPATNAVSNMDQELFHWSLESIGTVIYERRLGGLSDHRAEEMTQFIQAARDMFSTTNSLFYLPRHLNKKLMPRTVALQDRSWATIFRQGQIEVDKKFEDIQHSINEGKEITGFLSTLLASGTLSMKEIYANVSELMAAAVDTTSNTMQWVLYELCRNPDIQSRIRDEVLSITPRGQIPSYGELQHMTYLKGFLKEILRLYPVVNAVTRITNEDMVLSGYHIPPNVRVLGLSYVTGRNPDHFPDPEEIKPERWQRGESREASHPFAWMAFGFGARMCIGRRVAELEIYLLTALLVQEFIVRPGENQVNLPMTTPFYVPQRAVLAQFADRP